VSGLIESDRLYLREVRDEDVTQAYVSWTNDPDVTRFLEIRFKTHTANDVLQYVRAMRSKPDSALLAIVSREDDRHLGNLHLSAIDREVHKTAMLALVLGEKSAWGRGFGSEAIRLATRYAFECLGLRKLTARCYVDNIASHKAFLKAGWLEEGRQRQQFLSDGKYTDAIWLGVVAAR
jgi:RimJ/RimL family protein N-acetyltransferase